MRLFFAEFIGTLLLILLGNGSVANVLLGKSKGQGSGWIVICTGWAIAVAIPVYLVGWISGAHLNPAVTLSMVLLGETTPNDALYYLLGQFLGAFSGAILVWLFYFHHWEQTQDPSLKLMCFCTKPAIRAPLVNFFVEVVATAVLIIGILSIFNSGIEIQAGLKPFLVGVVILGIGLCLGGPTGFAINPARDLSPRIAHAILPIAGKQESDWSYAWVPIAGPFIGSCVGVAIFQLLTQLTHQR